jgi:hypothetical protein
MEIKPTPDEMMDFNRYGKIPLGFYEVPGDNVKGWPSGNKLEPLENCLEIRAAKELAEALESAREMIYGLKPQNLSPHNESQVQAVLDKIRAALVKAGRLPQTNKNS